MASQQTDIVVSGHICLDIIPAFHAPEGKVEFEDLFRPGKLTQMDRVVTSSGGPVSNTGIALLILGMSVELMGKVGDDSFAGNLLELLARRGLDKAMVQMPGEQTSYTIVLAPPGIDRMFLHCPGANDTYGADDLNMDVLAHTRAFHLGYPPLMKKLYANKGAELATVFRRIKERFPHVCTSLDMSLPDPNSESGKVDWRTVLTNTVPYIDIFLPSAEELLFMLEKERFLALRDEARKQGRELLDLIPAEDIMRLSDELISMGAKVHAIKLGHRGFYIRSGPADVVEKVPQIKPDQLANWTGRELWHASFHVENIASATGSGDSSIAGFLASFLRGLTVEDALATANATGGCNITCMDALSGIKDWEETRRLATSAWKNNTPLIDHPGWKEVLPGHIWRGPRDAPPGA